jgi:hypothetical protein
MQLKDPVRPINQELLSYLELVSTHVFPLPGGSGPRVTSEVDARISKKKYVTGLKDATKGGDFITYYEHICTVRDNNTKKFYIAFRETADALYARSQDAEKFPSWLMATREKMNERQLFIHEVVKHPNQVAVLRSHEDWLQPLNSPELFDAIVFFLSKNGVISAEEARTYA